MNVLKTVFIAMIFSFFVTGCDVLINPQAKIVVTQRTTTIFNNAGVFDFSKVEVNKSSTVVFKIENKGRKTLKLTGSPIIEIFGQDKDSFSISAQPETSIRKGENTTFELRFSPTESKFYEAALSIPNNDPKRNPFVFTVKGRGVIIDIDVRQGSTHIANDTGLFDFGEIYLGNPGSTFTFTIENIGSTTLYLTGTQNLIEIQGYGASAFKINQTMTDSELQPGEATTFDITFDPQTGGIKTAKILFENSDPDENPYNFMIRGICLSPEIQVLDPDKKDIPNITGEYTFPDNHLNNKREYTFTIKNLGTTDLILSGSPFVEITGTNSSSFTVIEQPDDSISAASNSTFVIAFKPTAESAYSATVTITNNDEDENPFVFTIRALGYATKFDFNGDGFDDIVLNSVPLYDYTQDLDIAYIFLGGSSISGKVDCTKADVIFKFHGNSHDVGSTITSAGDINGDCFDDILLSYIYRNNDNRLFVFFGMRNPPSTLSIKDADVIITPEDDLHLYGYRLSSAGDFNNDGYDDFIVGCTNVNGPGFRTHVFLGRQNWKKNLKSSDADIEISGSTDVNDLQHISGAGDFNGDGFDDIVIGCRIEFVESAYVFFGKMYPDKSICLEDADVILNGENDNDNFGESVCIGGDINNDGYDDIVIGAPNYQKNAHAGCVYVYYGSRNPKSVIDPLDADIRILGDTPHSYSGRSVRILGDINNDGYDDFAISKSSHIYALEPENGGVYVFYGSSNLTSLMELNDCDILIDLGITRSVGFSATGDFNGDRKSEIHMTYSHDYSSTYLFLGSDSLSHYLEPTDSFLEFYDVYQRNVISCSD